MYLYTLRMLRSQLHLLFFGIIVLVIYSTITMIQAQYANAQQEDPATPTAVDNHNSDETQIFLPVVFGTNRSIVQQIADNLPTNCKNCLTRETFLALPAEELAQIEENERKIRAMAKEQEAYNANIRSLIQEGKIDTTGMLSDAEIEAMSAGEIQEIAAQQNALWRKALANVDQNPATMVPDQQANFVTVPVFRLPEEGRFINACGLNAIKITLGVHMPTHLVP